VIVVGVDRSEGSRAALRWAAYEARVRSATVVVVESGPPVYDLVSDSPEAVRRRAATHEALDAFVTATLGGPPPEVGTRVVDGPAAAALARTAARADLLVVGRTGVSGVARLVLGSTAAEVLRGAPCPVAVVPADATPNVRRVVVGTDGSPGADRAVRWAARAAASRNVALVVVHAAAEAGDAVAAQAFVDECVAKSAVEAGGTVDVTGVLAWEQPASALLATAGPSDVLVVGSRGLGTAARLLLGSTSAAVADRAECPVVVVPGEG
jgi:nucleotide-binding universal stress UspA family protein